MGPSHVDHTFPQAMNTASNEHMVFEPDGFT